MSHNVWVYIDHFKGAPLQPSWEAVGAARTVATELGTGVAALVFGEGIGDAAQAAIHHGADAVYVCDDVTLEDFRVESYSALLVNAVREHSPAVLIAPATTRGRDILAMAAVDLDTSAVADGIALETNDGVVSVTRPVYAGKLLSTVSAPGQSTQLISLRSRAFPKPEPDESRTGETISLNPVLPEDDIVVKVEGYDTAEGKVSLTDASIIVSGGRGVGGPEGFAPVLELAKTLGGAMGASRAAVDAGWIPYVHQVGQTGKTVAPDLYIACGISGAIQHQAGMRTSKVIVAINTDPEAPIFKLAKFGVVGDLFDIVPALTAEFKERLGK